MQERMGKTGRLAAVLVLCVASTVGLAGCQKKQGDGVKTYTPDAKPGAQGGGGEQESSGGSGGASSEAKTLNAPADTTNGRSSKASDVGTSEAVKGQVVSEPGAPVAHEPKPAPRQGGHS